MLSGSTVTTRTLGRLCIGLFLASGCFPVAASISTADAPRWLGFADVGIAGLLLSTAMMLAMRSRKRLSDRDRLSAFRISQTVIYVIPVLLFLFFIAAPRINWDVLVIGLAWRGWLLLYSLPHLVAANRALSDLPSR